MVEGIWGKKIGMTQVFAEDRKVIPVTAIDISNWIVTQVKTKDRDGYSAVQVGCLRDRYVKKEFEKEWLKKLAFYFEKVREICLEQDSDTFEPGKPFMPLTVLNEGVVVDVFGTSTGHGFQGAVKRHGFKGGRGSHGCKLGRAPGSMSFMRSQARVIKGHRLPGHMGCDRTMVQNLKVVKCLPESSVILVKGGVPGKAGSFVFLRKRG